MGTKAGSHAAKLALRAAFIQKLLQTEPNVGFQFVKPALTTILTSNCLFVST